jgi:hypothetical protein
LAGFASASLGLDSFSGLCGLGGVLSILRSTSSSIGVSVSGMDEPFFERQPELAILMARYIANFSVTEMLLSGAFAAFINDDGTFTHAVLHQIRNVSDRIKAFQNLINSAPDERAEKPLLVAILPKLVELNAFRNILAHGLWANELNEDGSATVFGYVLDTSRKLKEEIVSVEIMSRKLDELIALNNTLTGLGFGRIMHGSIKFNGDLGWEVEPK